MDSHRSRVMVCTWLFSFLVINSPVLGEEPPKKNVTKSSASQGADTEKGTPSQPVGRPPEPSKEAKPQELATLFEQPGVLTPRGTLVLEPSFQYANTSSNRVALSGYTVIPSFTVGLIDVQNVNSNLYIASLGARYGITNRLEFEAKVPYVYRSDSNSFESTTGESGNTQASVFNTTGSDIGDVEFGPRFQLNQPGGEGPFFTAGLRVKTTTGKDPFEVPYSQVKSQAGNYLPTEQPTGSGFWALQPSITAIFASDPAVFFGTLSYMWNIERDVAGQGRLDPGDTVGANFGIGVGLNEKTSFSIGYDHIILGKTKRNGETVPGSIITQVGSLLFGISYRLNEKTSINFSLGAGLTPTASNVQLTLRLPTSFSLFGK